MKEKLKHRFVRDITLKQLSVLSAIAKTGRITSAANQLGVTPPAITLQLKLLEKAAGMPLFDRTASGMRLTDAGAYIAQFQTRIAEALSECSDGLDDMRGIGRGHLRVGIVSTAKYFAPKIIAQFSRIHPNIKVELSEGNREQTIAALADFKIDLAIMGRPPEAFEVQHQIIGDHPHVIIAEPSHPLRGKRKISLKVLSGEPFLMREPGSGTRQLMDKLLQRAKIVPSSPMVFGSNETIKQAVIAGFGIAFISAHTIAAEVESGRLAILDVEGLPVVRDWYSVRAAGKHSLPASQAFWEFLALECAAYLPNLPLPEASPRAQPRRKGG